MLLRLLGFSTRLKGTERQYRHGGFGVWWPTVWQAWQNRIL